jgi:SRSO17 transposase
MEARYAFRTTQLLDECQVAPEIFEQVVPRLYTFMAPFVKTFQRQVATQHAKTYVCGLLSDVKHKNVASMAYRFGQSRLPLQGFIGWGEWADEPLRQEWIGQGKTHVGQADGVFVFDPSGFPTSGRESVGVVRQWCGRLGNVDTCHVAIDLGSVSSKGHSLVDTRLSLPQEWTKDKARLATAGVPKACRAYRPRHQLALEMLAKNGAALPHRWMAEDDAMGRPAWWRRRLAALGECSMLAVPSNTMMRDLETPAPAYGGQGGPPQRPWQGVATWTTSLGDDAWRRIDVRAGSKGPLVVEVVTRRVVSRTHRRQPGDAELLVVIRSRARDQEQVVQVDYYLSNAALETPLWEVARVAKAAHRIAECMQRSQSEAGLADYEVRHGTGWQHHQTLSFLATWFLVRETQRGKKWPPRSRYRRFAKASP